MHYYRPAKSKSRISTGYPNHFTKTNTSPAIDGHSQRLKRHGACRMCQWKVESAPAGPIWPIMYPNFKFSISTYCHCMHRCARACARQSSTHFQTALYLHRLDASDTQESTFEDWTRQWHSMSTIVHGIIQGFVKLASTLIAQSASSRVTVRSVQTKVNKYSDIIGFQAGVDWLGSGWRCLLVGAASPRVQRINLNDL